ncbi:hypothetical protein PAESOLCIP111_02919 [Paenibacillus solanacearum]|uniref:DUF3817 domain-containing protein n=1 Tax=Paenibacillus solanacearum TaxID=2048548 RepID=A0A916K2M3_9BACL|nr:DUF3817 domain-containing protein [Paenibacillus solanacearum]CAG7627465.1 hypothetical protein PAESOLCIP111_02919 [Paenibacillus solanacearum]
MGKSVMGIFRSVGIIEGFSYLILLFIAMPLKYYADMPVYVRVVGMAHGVLFVLFLLLLLIVWIKHRWTLLQVFLAIVAVLLPFGTFILEARLRKTIG